MNGRPAPSPDFFVDADAWTCQKCGFTFRSSAGTAERRAAQRRATRDSHKCDPRAVMRMK